MFRLAVCSIWRPVSGARLILRACFPTFPVAHPARAGLSDAWPECSTLRFLEASTVSTMENGNSLAMIEAIGLSKFYRDFAAIRDVTFSIPAGQVVAFLGPNGAGKSTTMKILTGYLAPSAGTARIAGLDAVSDRVRAAERLGYLPENGPLYPEMTPLALLRFFGRARGLTGSRLAARIDDVIHRCALHSVIEKSICK